MPDPKSASKSFTLTDNTTGQSWELPLLEGTIGPGVIDIRTFGASE